jgi:hypothetical protein
MLLSVLPAKDREEFLRLKSQICSQRYVRGQRVSSFEVEIGRLIAYCDRSIEGKWPRYFACGICRLPTCFAVNIQRLKGLLGKSKSSLNGVFQKMGFERVTATKDEVAALRTQLKRLNLGGELRQWTFKRMSLAQTAAQMELPDLSLAHEDPAGILDPSELPAPRTMGFEPLVDRLRPDEPHPLSERYFRDCDLWNRDF